MTELPKQESHALDPIECVVTFPVRSGILVASRRASPPLRQATRSGNGISGIWVDWRHSAIRITFDTAADAATAKSAYDATATMRGADAR